MFLGIEIGGTKLQLGIGPGDGTLHALWRGAVDPARGADGIRSQIEAAVPALLAQARLERSQVRGAGIGFGYVTNRMLGFDDEVDPRRKVLIDAVYESL